MVWSWDNGAGGYRDQMDFITDDLAVASLEVASDLPTLTRHGIRAVVDASNREGNPRFPGIRYHLVPIADPDERLVEYLPGVVAFIDDARRSGPVLLHCVAGISRSPALAICYLHERHNLPLPAALDQVCSRRAQADPHPRFLRLIQDYYQDRTQIPGGTFRAVADLHADGQPASPRPDRRGAETGGADRGGVPPEEQTGEVSRP